MNAAFLSICIPTYNRSEYLKDLLEDLCFQISLANAKGKWRVEICISDNASTDNTTSIVSNYQAQYDFIAYQRNEENIGFRDNLIKVGEMAKSEFVWWFGDDDLLMPGGLKIVMENIDKYNYDGHLNLVIVGRAILDNYSGRILCSEPDRPTRLYDKNNPIVSDLNYGDINVLSGIVIKKVYSNVLSEYHIHYPQVINVVSAMAEGNQLLLSQSVIIYRYIHNNPSWIGMQAYLQAIECPSLNVYAKKLGIPSDSLKNTYQYKHALYSYFKLKLYLDNLVILQDLAETNLKKEMPMHYKIIMIIIKYILEFSIVNRVLRGVMGKLKPSIHAEILLTIDNLKIYSLYC